MGPKPANRIGLRYGKLTVIDKPLQAFCQKDPKFLCRCDCGTEKLIARSNLRRTKSCGCAFSRYGTLRERLEEFSIPEPNSGCWLWLGSLTHYDSNDGHGAYGKIMDGNKRLKAHRASYEVHVGKIPAKIEVCHSCDNPYCINPDHLFLGTHLDNMKDRDRKGRRQPPKGMKNGWSILTDETVRDIRAATGTLTEIGERFGTHLTNVSLIRRRKSWKHVD